MTVLVTLTAGLALWIAAWAFGIKAFDAFLFTFFITVVAAGWRIARPAGRPASGTALSER